MMVSTPEVSRTLRTISLGATSHHGAAASRLGARRGEQRAQTDRRNERHAGEIDGKAQGLGRSRERELLVDRAGPFQVQAAVEADAGQPVFQMLYGHPHALAPAAGTRSAMIGTPL